MLINKPDLAPGCYGVGLAFKDDAAECRGCPFARNCKPVAEESLARLRAELGIKAPKPPQPRIVQSAHPMGEQPAALGMSMKAKDMMGRIERAGVLVSKALREGRNPFTKKPAFLLIACHLLLKLPQGLDRQLLKTALMQKLNWTDNSASSHVAQVFQLLPALGACVEIDGFLHIRR